MKAFAAIYALTLRAALRERVVWSMLALTGLVLLLLPPVLRGDGTFAGGLRMHIHYTLGFCSVLLATMTLWMSCGTLASDLGSKRLQMVLTKPVSRAVLWAGKWAAVSTVATTVLLLCGAVTHFHVSRRVAGAEISDAEREQILETLLTARRPERPAPFDVTDMVQELLAAHEAAGLLPPDIPREAIERELYNHALVTRNSAGAGESVRWEFTLSAPMREGESLQLAYRFDGASMGITRIPGEWRAGRTGQEPDYTRRVHQSPSGEFVLEINEEGRFTGARDLYVEFHNLSEERDRVFFPPRGGVALYRPDGAFGPNLFRALLLIAGLMSLMAALGVSAGGLFSLPVACYVTAVTLLMQLFSSSVEQTLELGTTLAGVSDPGPALQAVDRVSMALYRGVHAVLRPLDVDSPLGRASRGVMISGGELASTLFLRMTPVLLVIALVGIVLFQRREAGVAE